MRFCPVCWQKVRSTYRGYVASHLDSVERDRCPMSGERYSMTMDAALYRTRYAA